jgi:hypothetical protein
MEPLGNGTRGDLERLGRYFDDRIDQCLELTSDLLRIRNRLCQCVRLEPNDAQRLYTNAAWGKQRNIVLKARQMGITTWVAGQFFLRTLLHPGTVTVQVAHTQEAAELIFRIVHRFLANLPEPLREGSALKSARLSCRRLLIPALDSEYLVETAGDRNAGRGLTITNLHCTELARWPGNAEETFYGLLATLSPAGTLVMESTPQGASGCFWKEWKDAEKTNTVRHFFPWWLERAYQGEAVPEESLTEEEQKMMTTHNLTLGQMAYRRQIRENFRGLAKQEYAEDAEACFLASGSCYFDPETIDERMKELTEPVETRRRGDLQIWFLPQPRHSYVVAVDPAGGGTGGDFTAIQVIDEENGLQCAELQGFLLPRETARAAADLAREYNQALLAVERNSLGQSVLAFLETEEKYANVYSGNDGMAGFLTSLLSRPAILSQMEGALVEEPRRFVSERLLRECRSFVRLENGRLEAKSGEHDDLVMAMAIALQVRKNELALGKPRQLRPADRCGSI